MHLSLPVAQAALRSKTVVQLLLIYCLMFFLLFVAVLYLYLFCYALLCVRSSFGIILKRKRELAALLLLSYICTVTINVLWLFLTVPWVGLQCVILVFLDHTHLLFNGNWSDEIYKINLKSGCPNLHALKIIDDHQCFCGLHECRYFRT